MQHHLEALADASANEWTHYPARHADAFFNVKIRIPVPADVANLPGSEGWKGVFTYGSGDGTAEEEFAGFTCSLSLGHEYPAQGMTVGCHRTIGERHYPCEHVPFEMPPGIAVRQSAPVHTQVIHVTENIPFQMPEGFQLAPGFEMIDGFPEWVGGRMRGTMVPPRKHKGNPVNSESRVFDSSDLFRSESTCMISTLQLNVFTNHIFL